MNIKQLKQRLLEDPQFKQEYESYDLAFEIGQLVLEARIIKGLTQKRLADLVKTKQSGIARLESGKTLPSFSFLQKIASALNTKLRVTLDLVDQASEVRWYTATNTQTRIANFVEEKSMTNKFLYLEANSDSLGSSEKGVFLC